MVSLRKLLLPFSAVYWLLTSIRNFFYDKGIFKSYGFDVPVIVVGNLSVGGTGKTPQIEYLVRLLSGRYNVAVLSRGYKRKSKGFVLAGATSDANILGDEPFQYYRKFPHIQVAVDADRVNGIERLLGLPHKPDVILLDDAYQHRRVRPGFAVLLTTYSAIYTADFLLPAGNLRESKMGAKRANIVIVTKCPPDLSLGEQDKIRKRLHLKKGQSLFFSYIAYDEEAFSSFGKKTVAEVKATPKLLLAGIAKPAPFFDYLRKEGDDVIEFPDHHDFSEQDMSVIRMKAAGRMIVTTEKDYVRLLGRLDGIALYYLPMRSAFLKEAHFFDEEVLDFVSQTNFTRSND